VSQTILITGANTGIGRATALALARRGVTLYLAGRSEARHRGVLAEVRAAGGKASYLALDLGDLASVRRCAEHFLALGEPLHVLLNNAGVAGCRGTTVSGFELAFGVNHLGHFLLTELLLERLKLSAPSRVVNVASKAHYGAKQLDWSALERPTRSLTGYREYEVSKLCNVLHAKELALRLEGTGVTTYALHPGLIASDVWRQVPWLLRRVMLSFMGSTEAGSATSLYCATSEHVAQHTGLYYDACRPCKPSRLARDPALARALYEKSAEWVRRT
jgi:NAD(P)-dependent dehydrogenase (short-subunit alcohol dehydrogenase family)